MRLARKALLRLRSLFRSSRVEQELDEEMRYHLERLVEQNRAMGMPPKRALEVALRDFGGLEQRKEECRDARAVRLVETFVQDATYAVRSLVKRPAFTVVALISLALGIGANTALFSILNALTLRPLPVEEPGRLALVISGGDTAFFTNAVWEQIRDRGIFHRSAAWSWDRLDLAEGGPTEYVGGIWVSGSLFHTLGLLPQLGRLVGEEDDRPGGGDEGLVVVVSHECWQRRFHGAPDVVGRSITIERRRFRVIGVTPPAFRGLDVGLPFDVALPLNAIPLVRAGAEMGSPFGPWVGILARLAPGQEIAAGEATLKAAQPAVREGVLGLAEYRSFKDREAVLAEPFQLRAAANGQSFLRRRYERPLRALLTAVGLVLLVACFNIANLQLSRTATRRHELSIRRALGATRTRLARQLIVESGLLACGGALLGMAFAAVASQVLVRQLSTQAYSVSLNLSPDPLVLAVTAGLAAGTALIFGTVPALNAASADPLEVQRQGRPIRARRGNPLGHVLVVAQIALSLVLVVAAGLFVRTFATINSLDVGFQRDPVLVVRVDAGRTSIPAIARTALSQRLSEAVGGLPGVLGTGVSLVLPGGNMKGTRLVRPAQPNPIPARTVSANHVSSGWFRTLGTPLLRGRDFDAHDREGAPLVGIVNQTLERHLWEGESALGRQLLVGEGADRSIVEVVGVTADAAYYSVREPPPPTLFLPIGQSREPLPTEFNLCVRGATSSPLTLSPSVASAVASVDRAISFTFRSLSDQVGASYAQERLVAMVSSFLAALGLLLAGLGVLGVTAHSVTQRRSEMAVRAALGASPTRIVRMVMVGVVRDICVGASMGLVGGLWASRFIASFLFGVAPRDPGTFAAGVVVLAGVGVLAGWVPARRAASAEPARLLRDG